MTPERYARLMETDEELQPSEFAEGWHFCIEWDGLLIGPGMSEMDCCHCKDQT